VIGEGIVLMTLALLASTRLAPITGAIIAVVMFGVAWMGGIAAAVGVAFDNVVLANIGVVVGLLLPTDALWRNALYNLEPIPALHPPSAPPPPPRAPAPAPPAPPLSAPPPPPRPPPPAGRGGGSPSPPAPVASAPGAGP